MAKRFALIALASLMGCTTIARAQAPIALDLVLERFRAYMTTYGDEYASTIATERYEQNDGPVRATLESEFGIIRLQDTPQWLGFRDVRRVNGRDVTSRPARLAEIFTKPSAAALVTASRITAESAAFNIGPGRRTLNNPATILEVLDPRHHARFRFSKDGEGRVEGTRVWEVRLVEHARPTLVRTSAGEDEPIDGRAWIDPATGRLLRGEIKVVARPGRGGRQPPPVTLGTGATIPHTLGVGLGPITDTEERLTLTVFFGREPRLNLWVPVRMRERHEEGPRMLFRGEATYSSYRRFTAESRIVQEEAK